MGLEAGWAVSLHELPSGRVAVKLIRGIVFGLWGFWMRAVLPTEEEASGELGRILSDRSSPVRRKMVQRLRTEFVFALPELLSGPQRPFAKQLERSGPMAEACRYIDERYPRFRSSALRRFLAGEFTGGVKPVYVSHSHSWAVERLLRVLDIVETMARDADVGAEGRLKGVGGDSGSSAGGHSEFEYEKKPSCMTQIVVEDQLAGYDPDVLPEGDTEVLEGIKSENEFEERHRKRKTARRAKAKKRGKRKSLRFEQLSKSKATAPEDSVLEDAGDGVIPEFFSVEET